MLIKAKVALAVAIVLCTAATAGIAATKPHRAGAGPAYTAGSSETNQCRQPTILVDRPAGRTASDSTRRV